MPTFDEYRDQIKSDIADLMNTGGRPAGSVTAALFLKEFTGGLPWAHLDIAGTAWARGGTAVHAEGTERRGGPHAGRARVYQPRMGLTALSQPPVTVRIIEPPVDPTGAWATSCSPRLA